MLRRVVRFVMYLVFMAICLSPAIFARTPGIGLTYASLAIFSLWAIFCPEHFSWIRKITRINSNVADVPSMIMNNMKMLTFCLAVHFVVSIACLCILALMGKNGGDTHLLNAFLDGIPFGLAPALFENDEDGCKKARREAGDAVRKLVERVVAIHGTPQPIPIRA